MKRRRGNTKVKLDKAVRMFKVEHPLHSHREIGEVFGLDHSYVSKILKKGEKDANHN